MQGPLVTLAPAPERDSNSPVSVGRLSWWIVIAWAGVWALLWPYHGMPLNWDEVDYVQAARLGFVANAVERGSLSLSEFVSFGLAKKHGLPPSLPFGYEERKDPLLLRHYHPPFVVLLLSAVSGSRSERVHRSIQLAGAMLFSAVVLWAFSSLSKSAGWVEALVIIVLTLQLVALSFRALSFHGWETVWAVCAAALLSRWLADRRAVTGLLCSAVFALSAVTLETGVLIWLGAGISVFIWSSGREPRAGRSLAGLLALALVLFLAVWPGSVLKASLLKFVALHTYRVGWGTEYANVGRGLPSLAVPVLPLLVLSLLSCVYLLWKHRTDSVRWGPFLVIGAVYGGGIIWFTLGLSYLVPAFALFVCLIGLALSQLGSWYRPAANLAVLGVVVVVILPSLWPSTYWEERKREDYRWLQGVLGGQKVLADGGHILQYYFGPEHAIRSITVSYDRKALLIRESGQYRFLGDGDVAGKLVVIQRGRELASDAQRLLADCVPIQRATFTVYDCLRSAGFSARER